MASKPQNASWCGLSVGIVPWAVGIHKHAVFLLEGSYLTTPALLGQLFLSFTQLLKMLKLSQNQSLTLSSWSLTPPEHHEVEELFCSDTAMLNAGHYQQRIPGLAQHLAYSSVFLTISHLEVLKQVSKFADSFII